MSTIELKGGLLVQADAIALALDLEQRGVTLTVKDGVLLAAPGSRLTAEDRVQVGRWKRHLMAIAAYVPPVEPHAPSAARVLHVATGH